MKTECIQKELFFQDLGHRKVVGKFEGGKISSDAGGLLLREVDIANNFIQIGYRKSYANHPKAQRFGLPQTT